MRRKSGPFVSWEMSCWGFSEIVLRAPARKIARTGGWPFTRAHERYHELTVTTVTCLKHPWSVRLYDPKNMRFVKAAEERRIVRQIQAFFDHADQTNAHAVMSW